MVALALLAAGASRAQASGGESAPESQFGDGIWLGDEGAFDEPAPPPPDDANTSAGPEAAPDDSSSAAASAGVPAGGEVRAAAPGAAAPGGAARDSDAQDPEPPQTAGPTLDDFHAALDGQGDWLDTPEYGLVWRPTQVDAQWQPYSDGQWVSSTAGWYWSGVEPYAWAVYHYGRWAYANGSWYWVPGRIWGASWVAWRWGNGYAGWAPLGPRGAVWGAPAAWVVVQQRLFLDSIRYAVQPVGARRGFLAATRVYPVSRPGLRSGPLARSVAQATGRALEPLRLQSVRSPAQGGIERGAALGVYRPQTRPILGAPAQRGRPARARPENDLSANDWHGNESGGGHEASRGKVIEFAGPARAEPREDGAHEERDSEESDAADGNAVGQVERAHGRPAHPSEPAAPSHAAAGHPAAGPAHPAAHPTARPPAKEK